MQGVASLPEIIACVITYNDEQMLPGCLQQIQDKVSRIIVVDGAFATFPLHQGIPSSMDATEEIARCYGAEWIPCGPTPWATEMEKRSAYLLGEDGDWYVHVDTDERLAGNLPELVDGNHYALIIDDPQFRSWAPRIWQHRGHMRYEGSHNALWSDDRLIHLKGAVQVPPAICHIIHVPHLRPAWQQLAKRKHYARRTPTERDYRATHGI